jgi:hypothetical protein
MVRAVTEEGSRQSVTDKTLEEFSIFAERYMHFINLWTVYSDILTKKYVPSINDEEFAPGMTIMLVLYAYFYSLVEDSADGLNGFRIWRAKFQEEESAIGAVEAQVAPFRGRLKLYRNRLGFHGSTTRSHEASGLNLFAEHSGTEIWNAMRNFKALGAALFAKANEKQGIGEFNAAQVRDWIDGVAERARQQTDSAAGSDE